MDGENNGKPYDKKMDDLGGKNPYFWVNTHMSLQMKNGSFPDFCTENSDKRRCMIMAADFVRI